MIDAEPMINHERKKPRYRAAVEAGEAASFGSIIAFDTCGCYV